MTSELTGKFRAKTDFIKYFSEVLQLYVPPDKMINKDFIKMVLTEQKSMLPLSEVRWVSVPHYDELSVKKFLPKFAEDEEFMMFMPVVNPESRVPERAYFWNVLNTVQNDYVQKVISHANNIRMKADEDTKAVDCIEVSEQWW